MYVDYGQSPLGVGGIQGLAWEACGRTWSGLCGLEEIACHGEVMSSQVRDASGLRGLVEPLSNLLVSWGMISILS